MEKHKKAVKKTLGKIGKKKPHVVVVVVSGGFDPLHIGHVRMFNEAKALGDRLVVIVNNDNWIKKKKGVPFMPEQERKEIIEAIGSVDEVVLTSHAENPQDMSVCAELEKIRPDVFANGGDRTVKDSKNTSSSLSPETILCEKLGIKMAFNVGHGGKIQSSSVLLKQYKENDSNRSMLQ